MIAAVRRGRRDASRETPRANRTESGLQAHPPFFIFLPVVGELSELDSTGGSPLVGIGGVCGQSYLLTRL